MTDAPVMPVEMPSAIRNGTESVAEATIGAVAKAALRVIGDNLEDGMVVVDAFGRVVTANRAAELLLGLSASGLQGEDCRQLLCCEDEDAFGRYHSSCHDGCPASAGEPVRRRLRAADHRSRVVSARSRPLPGGGTICTFAAVGDGKLDRTAAEFLTNVSHELRTPLSSLASSIELLSVSYEQMPKEDVGRVLRVIHHSTMQLHNLVENLLSASSIQLGSFHIQPRISDLEAIVEDATSFVQPLLDKKAQRLTVRIPVALSSVVVDARRIGQVIVNLLSNAIKYGPFGDEIVLSATQHGRQVVVNIREHGPGIAPGDQRGIFERFYRVRRGPTEGEPGVGLGLAMVKSIVTAHGGKVGVRSDVGAGSTFWFTLPLEMGGSVPRHGKGKPA